MAHTKSGGETAKPGSILVRQRGTKFVPGDGAMIGKDDTIFAVIDGKVTFEQKRKINFDGSTRRIHRVSVQ